MIWEEVIIALLYLLIVSLICEFDFPRDGFCNFSQLPSDAPSHLHRLLVLSHIRIGSL